MQLVQQAKKEEVVFGVLPVPVLIIVWFESVIQNVALYYNP